MYELPYEFPNDLRLRILGNCEIIAKSQNFIKLLSSAHSFSQNENFVCTRQNPLKSPSLSLDQILQKPKIFA